MRRSAYRGSRLLRFAFAAAIGAALAGCGAGSGSFGGSTIHPPGGTIPMVCTAIVLPGPPLQSPAPGSTGVPASLSVLTFGPLPIPDIITATATLSGSDGSTITSGPLTFTSTPPTGAYTASIAGLQPHTTYTVKVTGTINERGCNYAVLGNDGSFTTQ
jgi:hypothetical protein